MQARYIGTASVCAVISIVNYRVIFEAHVNDLHS